MRTLNLYARLLTAELTSWIVANRESVCEAWIPATADYGFVSFKSQQEQQRAIGASIRIHGKVARIQPDTREQRRATGVMDAIWAAYARFARVQLADLDNDNLHIPEDPEIECVVRDPAAEEVLPYPGTRGTARMRTHLTQQRFLSVGGRQGDEASVRQNGEGVPRREHGDFS